MSWKASGFVKELIHTPCGRKLLPSEKCILYTLADYYDEEKGAAWPSIERLAKESLLSQRQCSRLIASLEEAGMLLVERPKNGTNKYRFGRYNGQKPPDNMSGGEKVTPVMDDTPHQTPATKPPDIAMAAKPSLTASEPESSPPTSEGVKPSRKGKKEPDKRHGVFKSLIFECFRFLNKYDPPWDGSEAKQLDLVLRASPDLAEEMFRVWLRNYCKSQRLNLKMRPREFLPKLHLCAGGPVDGFWKPIPEQVRVSADPEISPAEKIRRQLQHRPVGLRETDGD